VRRERIARIVGGVLLLVVVAGVMGCDRIREAVDGLRRSTSEGWDRGSRRIGR
jgi:hypothetical protein